MYSLCLTFSYFFFKQKRITKICLEQMFMSGSNIREAAEVHKSQGWFMDLYWCYYLLVILWMVKWLMNKHFKRFQPYLLKKGGFGGGIVAPMSAEICASKMSFPAFWDHTQWKYCAQNYCRLMIGCWKGTSGWLTTEKGQRSAKKTG